MVGTHHTTPGGELVTLHINHNTIVVVVEILLQIQDSSQQSDAMPRVCMEHTALVTCRGSGGDGEAWLVATVAPVS